MLGSNIIHQTGEPKEAYRKEVLSLAEKVSGRTLSSYEEAVFVLGQAAKEWSAQPDLLSSMDAVDALFSQDLRGTQLAVSVAITLRLTTVVVGGGGAAAAAVSAAARTLGMETAVVRPPRKGATASERKASSLALMTQLARLPTPWSKGTVVMVSDLSGATSEYSDMIAEAMLNRRIGQLPVPAGIHLVLLEREGDKAHGLPPTLLAGSVILAGTSDEDDGGLTARERLLKTELMRAVESGDDKAAARLSAMLAGAGYAGGRGRARAALIERGVVDSLALEVSDLSGSNSRHTDAALIIEVTRPGLSEGRERLATELLTGVGGGEFAMKALMGYFEKERMGRCPSLSGEPTVETVMSGEDGPSEIESALHRLGFSWLEKFALTLDTSSVARGEIEALTEAGLRLLEAQGTILDLTIQRKREKTA